MPADALLGCLLGGALGDGLGAAYEGRGPAPDVEWPAALRLTDDTQLTLATCEALVASKGRVDPAAIAAAFARWFSASRLRGLGASTWKALSELAQGGHWALVGRKGDMAAGNGAAMRVAPLAFVLDPLQEEDRLLVRDVSRITHHHEEAYVGALAVVIAVRLAWTGAWTGGDEPLLVVADRLPDSQVRDRLRQIGAVLGGLSLSDVATRWGASGFVVESVPLALCGAVRCGSMGFERSLVELVACGGDTDTVASIAAQVAGARTGAAGLPAALVARLPEEASIRELAGRLSRLTAGGERRTCEGHPPEPGG